MHVYSFSILSSCSTGTAFLFLTHLMLFVWFLGVCVLSHLLTVCLCSIYGFHRCYPVLHPVMAIFMLITLLVSLALPAIRRPSTRVMPLSFAQSPSQERESSAPCMNLPFRPVFLKSQELHVSTRNLTSATQIFASRSMLYSHP